jgi:hypothetical protein
MEVFWRDVQAHAASVGIELNFLRFKDLESPGICFEIADSSFEKASESYESYEIGFVVRSQDIAGLLALIDTVAGYVKTLSNTEISSDYIINTVQKVKLPEYSYNDDFYFGLLLYKLGVTNKNNL